MTERNQRSGPMAAPAYDAETAGIRRIDPERCAGICGGHGRIKVQFTWDRAQTEVRQSQFRQTFLSD